MTPIKLIQKSMANTHRLTAEYRATLDAALCSKTPTQGLILLSMRTCEGLTPAKAIMQPVAVVAARQSFWRLSSGGLIAEAAQYHPRTGTLTHYAYELKPEGRALADQIHDNITALIESVQPAATAH
mgnify:CR=1 FL=1